VGIVVRPAEKIGVYVWSTVAIVITNLENERKDTREFRVARAVAQHRTDERKGSVSRLSLYHIDLLNESLKLLVPVL
jgi:hypothetical protein